MLVTDLPERIQQQIHARVSFGEKTAPATVVDLSLSGTLVADLDLGVRVGDRVRVELEFDGRSAALEGAVVREVDRGSVGIRFPESVRNGQFEPPVRLSNLHRRLERLWLQSREK